MADVEIQWPDQADTAPLFDAAADLQDAGIETECFVQPVRRGGGVEAMVLVALPAMAPFLNALFEKVGGDAYEALRGFVHKVFTRRHDGQQDATPACPRPAPTAVVFESRQTGAQFVFTPGLPDKAFRAALQVDVGIDPGRWVWDTGAAAWLRLENGTATEKDG